jgi:hypothetical protein
VNIVLTYDNMSKYGKDFHVAVINEIMNKGVKHLSLLNVNVKEVNRMDVSYDFSK